MVRSTERPFSKNNFSPRRTLAGVSGLFSGTGTGGSPAGTWGKESFCFINPVRVGVIDITTARPTANQAIFRLRFDFMTTPAQRLRMNGYNHGGGFFRLHRGT